MKYRFRDLCSSSRKFPAAEPPVTRRARGNRERQEAGEERGKREGLTLRPSLGPVQWPDGITIGINRDWFRKGECNRRTVVHTIHTAHRRTLAAHGILIFSDLPVFDFLSHFLLIADLYFAKNICLISVTFDNTEIGKFHEKYEISQKKLLEEKA